MRKNGKGNPLKTPALVRIILLSVMAGIIAACFVVIRNRHVKKGDEIREAEIAIVALNEEIKMLENRTARLLGRADLTRHLRWIESDLEEIHSSRILHVHPDEELPALPKVAATR